MDRSGAVAEGYRYCKLYLAFFKKPADPRYFCHAIKRLHMLGAGFLKVRDKALDALRQIDLPIWEGGPLLMILQTEIAHLHCFAGVLNDYIISSVCSTLLFYGGFSIAVNKKKKKYISSHLLPGFLTSVLCQERKKEFPDF